MISRKSTLKNSSLYKFIRRSGKQIRKNIKKFSFVRKIKKATPVFVFQMGKVASSSVFDSLTRQYPGPVGHAHHIGEDNWMSVFLYNHAKSGNKLNIISPVREPVGRNISGFFQRFEDYLGMRAEECTLSQHELDTLFLEKNDHDQPLEWFDSMMKPHFDIDVYARPFPDTGHATYSNKNINLLVFRIDIPDAIKEDAIRDFLDFPEFRLEKSNVGSAKEYNSQYTEFKKNTTLPEAYLDRMCSSKYFRHFYTESEIASLRKKWERS
jgi:hypothetical protein